MEYVQRAASKSTKQKQNNLSSQLSESSSQRCYSQENIPPTNKKSKKTFNINKKSSETSSQKNRAKKASSSSSFISGVSSTMKSMFSKSQSSRTQSLKEGNTETEKHICQELTHTPQDDLHQKREYSGHPSAPTRSSFSSSQQQQMSQQ